MDYNFTEIEKKWQAIWKDKKPFRADNASNKPKYYVLDMFPYPSGAGLHVGHPLGYIASDIMARYKRHKGFNVLHPMGYDSFGLPAEQYAIQTGQHPKITTEQNIARYREQLDKIGFSFDWEREVRTSDPAYYKWTQWIFIQIFNSWYNKTSDKAEHIDTLISEFEKNGNANVNAVCDEETKSFTAEQWKNFSEKEKSDALMQYRLTYLGEAYVNWCPALGTVLANDEVKDGVSERGGHPVERKLMKQWSMRITAYAQRLLDGLDTIDWSESLKESQRYWIGKSEGTSLKFSLIPNPSPKEKGINPHWKTADPSVYEVLKKYARENRQPLTESEDVLWQALRNRKLEAKFRRQHPIGTYIADFISLENNLIIEVDGKIHEHQKEKDAQRTKVLNILGYEVIRFINDEVTNSLTNVLEKIKTKLSESTSPSERGQGGEARTIEVFTTRPDTIFGVSFVTLAPEHDLVEIITTTEQKKAVDEYVSKSKSRSERERQAEVTKVSGVFTGAYVEHPFTGKQIPIWVGDYVLAGYGTGAVMAVPGHDSRDYAFAKHFGLDIIEVVAGGDLSKESYDAKEGKLINSDFLNGLEVKDALKKAISEIEKRGLGKGKINYRLRDAVFGRQRYWGEPIPIYYQPARLSNGNEVASGDVVPHALPENELPLVLPEVDKFLPTEDGEPPLARAASSWKKDGLYDYEHTTMPGWAGSSWYYLRYMDADNGSEFAAKDLIKYWQQVDLYIGGSEHATGHLLYVRFWTKFLKDLGYLTFEEPMKKLINQGMIQGRSNLVYRLELHSSSSNHNIHKIKQFFVGEKHYKLLQNKNTNSEIQSLLNNKLDEQYGIESPFEILGITPIHIDVNLVNNDTISLSKLKNWHSDFKNAEFPLEDNENEILCGTETEKMSKRWYNVVTPDLICEKFGADTLRLYEMFLGPLEQSKPWNTNGITGVSGFLKKLWRLFHSGSHTSTPLSVTVRELSVTVSELSVTVSELNVTDGEPTKAELKTLHKTIKKITEDIERFSFNTSVSNFMICVNELTEQKCNKRAILEPLLVLISPYAPHIAEELWEQLGHTESITFAEFPICNEAYLVEDSFTYPISFNGKMKFNIELPATLTVQEIEKEVMSREEIVKHLNGISPKKIIIVPKKIVNIVI